MVHMCTCRHMPRDNLGSSESYSFRATFYVERGGKHKASEQSMGSWPGHLPK